MRLPSLSTEIWNVSVHLSELDKTEVPTETIYWCINVAISSAFVAAYQQLGDVVSVLSNKNQHHLDHQPSES
jgi:hypothetical protein